MPKTFTVESYSFGLFGSRHRVVDNNGYIYASKLNVDDAMVLARHFRIVYHDGISQGKMAGILIEKERTHQFERLNKN